MAALAKTAEDAAEAAVGGNMIDAATADLAQKSYDAAIASHTSLIDPQIFSAVVFAVIGFCLVTGIEVAGKMLSKKKD